MLEASSLRSRKHLSSPTETKTNNNNSNNGTLNATNLTKEKMTTAAAPTASMANDSGTSLSGSSESLDQRATGMATATAETTMSMTTAPTRTVEAELERFDEEMNDATSPSGTHDQDQRSDDSVLGQSHQQPSPQQTSFEARVSLEKPLGTEESNGGLLDGTLDDEDEGPLDQDSQERYYNATQDADKATAEQDHEDEEEQEEEEDEPEQENEEEEGEIYEENEPESTEPESEAHDDMAIGLVDEASSQQSEGVEEEEQEEQEQEDGDGDVAMAEQEEDDEEEEEVEEGATPAVHTEDEEGSDVPEEEGEDSHLEEDDEEVNGEVEDDDEDEDEQERPVKSEVIKKDATSYPQKPTLNRPSQLIEEELKDSGDEELSDLSEFDDTDDSDDEDVSAKSALSSNNNNNSNNNSNKGKAIAGGSSSALVAGAATSSANSTSASSTAASNSRATAGGRKRLSLRETSRERKEQEERAKKEANDAETNDQQSDKESGSEVAGEEEEADEEKVEGEEDVEEEEDLEKKQKHMDALEALTTIEVEFASLRDKMYEERMLELDREVEMINVGTHPELSTLMREIEDKREQRLRAGKAWRTHMGEIAQCEFEIKEYQAHCTFQSKKREMRNDITTELGSTKRKAIMELTLSSESHIRKPVLDKLSLVRARKQRRAEANELRTIKEQIGFPTSTKLRMISTNELDEDFGAMGLSRPALQPNAVEHVGPHQQHYQQHHGNGRSSLLLTSSMRPGPGVGTGTGFGATHATAAQRWNASADYSPSSHHPNHAHTAHTHNLLNQHNGNEPFSSPYKKMVRS